MSSGWLLFYWPLKKLAWLVECISDYFALKVIPIRINVPNSAPLASLTK